MITATDLTFAYPGQEPVLCSVSLDIQAGTHVAVMGANGSGKSTLALLIKGLLHPVSGSISVDGFSLDNDTSRFEIMKRVGLVFQNPDHTIVATTVEREIAFGLENSGVPPDEMKHRVNVALDRFGLMRYRHTNPANLSGGEKQRCALAGVMVMQPSHLILDEPTSLLDPENRSRLLSFIHEAADHGTTVIHITPFIEEARTAGRVIVLDNSGICMDGSPDEILKNTGQFRTCSVSGADFRDGAPAQENSGKNGSAVSRAENPAHMQTESATLVSLDNVAHIYDNGTPFQIQALQDISMRLSRCSSTAVLGPSGSGKSTFLEIVSGVITGTGGSVCLEGNPLRAMAFQFPEDQMFGDTVASYVSFGPRNTGISEDDMPETVATALASVGLDPDRYRSRDPLMLSGGEQRRAALAGVLAMNPDVLVLDEPIAGLDRSGMEIIIQFLHKYVACGGTLLFSTHDFEVAWRLAAFAVVLRDGCMESYGEIDYVFRESEWLNGLRNGQAGG